MGDSVKQEFDNIINRLAKSNAYLDYCEEVYGYRMSLFNMMDREQLSFLFYEIPLTNQDTVLDLGCGSGSILNMIVKNSGCLGIGIDQFDNTTGIEENGNIQYIKGDIDDIEKFNFQPTITLLVDSIYFSKNPEHLIYTLSHMKNNRIYLFYSSYLFEDSTENQDALQGHSTKIAKILEKNKLPYQMVEYSINEKVLYERSLYALEKRKEMFSLEGNLDLYEDKMEDQRIGKHLYDTEHASRYLYIIG